MRPEPNFPVRPDEFVGRRQHIEAFREALQQGLTAGRTSSFAILGDWGIGKSSLPIPQSPRIANELVRPAVSPCCKASRNASMCCLRPTNSSGLTGKLGSGRMSDLQNHRAMLVSVFL